MPGLGRPPKPANQRRNRAKPRVETISLDAQPDVKVPPAARSWHPVAKRWYASLASSPTASLYQPSDWATAFVLAESMSRELKPQPVKIGKGDDAETVMVEMPISAAALNAWRLVAAGLLTTEAERRKMRVEIARPKPVDDEACHAVWLEDFRARLRGEPDRYADL